MRLPLSELLIRVEYTLKRNLMEKPLLFVHYKGSIFTVEIENAACE